MGLDDNSSVTHLVSESSVQKYFPTLNFFIISRSLFWLPFRIMPVSLRYQQPRKTKSRYQVVPSGINPQDRSQQSETSANGVDSAANARPFPFLKLPAELRNKIYSLVVIGGQDLVIMDMHLDEFKKCQENGTYQHRSTYLPTDHVCNKSGWLENHHINGNVDSCTFRNPLTQSLKTTYKVEFLTFDSQSTTPFFLTRDVRSTTRMLSVNKQTRSEAASIFYGKNTFQFNTMSSLVPFLKDRTAETRKYIRSLHVVFTIDIRDWDAVFTEYGRSATWNTTCSTLAKLPHLNVKKLFVEVDDKRAKLLRDGMSLRSRTMLWLHKLGKLENLEKLGVSYDCGDWQPHGRRFDIREEVDSQTEQELWQFLAPKMLKMEADDHGSDALQRRRIWEYVDISTFTILSVTGESGSDSDDNE